MYYFAPYLRFEPLTLWLKHAITYRYTTHASWLYTIRTVYIYISTHSERTYSTCIVFSHDNIWLYYFAHYLKFETLTLWLKHASTHHYTTHASWLYTIRTLHIYQHILHVHIQPVLNFHMTIFEYNILHLTWDLNHLPCDWNMQALTITLHMLHEYIQAGMHIIIILARE